MALKFYNTLTRKKENFKPLKDKGAGLYTCGPTVYNYAHIGNLRTYIFEDILRRVLEYSGYKVKHIMNITDVEDKIIRDLKKLNIEPAYKYPKATGHVKDMIKIIESLLKRGLAYKATDSIYFNISKFKKYGRLSGVKTREL